MGKKAKKKVAVATRIWPETKEFAQNKAEEKGMQFTDYVDEMLSQDIDKMVKEHELDKERIKKENEEEIEKIKEEHKKEVERLYNEKDKLHESLKETGRATTKAQDLHAELKIEYNQFRQKQELLEYEAKKPWYKKLFGF